MYYNKILVEIAKLFINKTCDNTHIEECFSISRSLSPEWRPPWTNPRDVLKDIFSFVWSKAVSYSKEVIQQENDPRDVLTIIFSNLFRLFLVEEPILGKCIILESHRYDTDKIRLCFMIPEVTEFLNVIRKYIKDNCETGRLPSINPDALLELFLSIQDGMMFAWTIHEDIGYSSKFSLEDFESISRMFVSSLLISPMSGSRIYYDGVAPSYDELYNDGISMAENCIIEDLLKDRLKKGDKILDLGCGLGLGYSLIAKHLKSDFQYFGIDISPEMIKKAKEKHLVFSNAHFSIGDMYNLSFFRKKHFDAVISLFGSFSHAIEHAKAITEIERILKNNGLIFIMVYSRYSLRNIVYTILKRSFDWIAEVHHYEIRNYTGPKEVDARFYTTKTIRQVFEKFSHLEIQGLNAFLTLPFFKSKYFSQEKWPLAKRLLLKEAKILLSFPNLSHSLIISGRYDGNRTI